MEQYKVYDVYKSVFTDVSLVEEITSNVSSTLSQMDHCIALDLEKRLAVSDTLSCSYCKIKFSDVGEQRAHYKLDWHRYNLKKSLAGLPCVGEEEFTTKADDVSSISGSDSSSDESDSETQEVNIDGCVANRHAKLLFKTKDNILFSVYRCLLQNKKENFTSQDLIQSFNKLVNQPQQWMVVMLGGGHFAAAVFKQEQAILHKTFHCYTVRAKQGGAQSTRDSKGNHPKSAGASLRRYNELALIQHVQEMLTSWGSEVSNCNLILYRAAGPQNKNVLFSGKSPPFDKNDNRLRVIPFPTRRATFKEVKRVFGILSTIQSYGSIENFQKNSPDRKLNKPAETNQASPKSKKINRAKERKSPIREIPGSDIKSVNSDPVHSDVGIIESELEVNFEMLKEFDDDVPKWVKEAKKQDKKWKKKVAKKKVKDEKEKCIKELEDIQKNLVASCRLKDTVLFNETLELINNLPVKMEEAVGESEQPDSPNSTTILSKQDVIEYLNQPIKKDTGDTLLHLAASQCLIDFIALLLKIGVDPTVKNNRHLPPYSVCGDKETKNAFKIFAAQYPDLYDYKKAQIPEPLTSDQVKEFEEKKKEKRKLKKEKEKIKKKDYFEHKTEYEEKARFLSLSDREKRALAAEKRIVQAATSHVQSKAPVLSRCFQCGIDITGKVPFEYDIHRFCSVVCLKSHRVKTNSFGKEI